jgi:glycosyltransferase involved in cell wall biosynthesis
MVAISIIICSHNPRPDYLRRTLAALKSQTLSKEAWELLLVDNASASRLADEHDLSWHPRAKHLREDEVGLTAARLCGIRMSQGEWLVFVDDDNILAPDYLDQVIALTAAHPQLGAMGAGVLEPEFESAPVNQIKPFLHRLAIRQVSTALWSNNPRDGMCCPFGAGLCANRATAFGFAKIVQQLKCQAVLGRRGNQLNSNEDDIFAWAAVDAGLGFGVFPALRITHLIPARRVTQQYMLQLLNDSSFSECVLYYLLDGVKPRKFGLNLIARVLFKSPRALFFMRCRLASARGEDRAARLIFGEHLVPAARFISAMASPNGLEAVNRR